MGKQWQILLFCAAKSLQMVTEAMKLKEFYFLIKLKTNFYFLKLLTLWKESYDQLRQHVKKQRHDFADKGLSSQSYGFSSSHVCMWELNHKDQVPGIDAFKLWWRGRLLRVTWTAKRSNQSILKEISPEYCHWKDWCWNWSCNTLSTWCKEVTYS